MKYRLQKGTGYRLQVIVKTSQLQPNTYNLQSIATEGSL
jgi:hypothetical protein